MAIRLQVAFCECSKEVLRKCSVSRNRMDGSHIRSYFRHESTEVGVQDQVTMKLRSAWCQYPNATKALPNSSMPVQDSRLYEYMLLL